ncbi:MAG: LysE family transporter [Methanomassiliicoccales archaeon]|nr:LysE family transporter [Methanomassiliicoccales archaeon]
MVAFWEGLIAGYGIAIPLGAVSILIVNTALDRGFRMGFVAGAGTATVDLLCAALAVFAGAAAVAFIAPYSGPLQMASGIALIAMGVYGILRLRKRMKDSVPGTGTQDGEITVYGKFVALTLLNPFTVAYFLALIIGKGAGWSFSFGDCLWFIAGVSLASLSWETLLAAIGALARKHLTPRFMTASILVGNGIVILLGAQIMLNL